MIITKYPLCVPKNRQWIFCLLSIQLTRSGWCAGFVYSGLAHCWHEVTGSYT